MRVSLKIIGHRMAVIAHFQTQRCRWTSHLSTAKSRSNRLVLRVPHDCLSLLIHDQISHQISSLAYPPQGWPNFPLPLAILESQRGREQSWDSELRRAVWQATWRATPRAAPRGRACGRNRGCPVYWMRRPRKCKRFNGSYRVPSQECRVHPSCNWTKGPSLRWLIMNPNLKNNWSKLSIWNLTKDLNENKYLGVQLGLLMSIIMIICSMSQDITTITMVILPLLTGTVPPKHFLGKGMSKQNGPINNV